MLACWRVTNVHADLSRQEHIKATSHLRSQWLAANVQCLLRNKTSDDEAQRVLRWLCDPDGGGHSCHGIKEGGSHYNPVNPKDHLEWAMTSLHEMHEGKENHGHRTCWFGGIAYLVVCVSSHLVFGSAGRAGCRGRAN